MTKTTPRYPQNNSFQREKEIEGSIQQRYELAQRKRRHQLEVKNASWFSQTFIGDWIVKNLDFFTVTFLEVNALVLTYPLQTLKTSMQGGSKYNSIDTIKFIFKNFGPLGFFKGLSAKVVQSVLNAALMLFMYERINERVIKTVKGF